MDVPIERMQSAELIFEDVGWELGTSAAFFGVLIKD